MARQVEEPKKAGYVEDDFAAFTIEGQQVKNCQPLSTDANRRPEM